MRICKCESCRYTFRYPILPLTCPDCGQKAVRSATEPEVRSYWIDQKILADEIRKGIYAATTI